MQQLLSMLQGVADPSRLRLLFLLGETELTVSELTTILGQSQPRVSRHLKLLCEAGLLQRFKEGSWVFHRLSDTGLGAAFAKALMELPLDDRTILAADHARLATVRAARTAAAVAFFRANAGDWERIRSDRRELGIVSTTFTGAVAAPAVDFPPNRRTLAAAPNLNPNTGEVLELCGLTGLRDLPVGSLPTGQRRLVDLARVLAGGFSFLLLDEPSSGLDTAETERFGRIVADVVAERGCGVLLVEHDMALVMSICDYLYVLDFGEVIFQGTPVEVRASDIVRAAYLGSEAA